MTRKAFRRLTRVMMHILLDHDTTIATAYHELLELRALVREAERAKDADKTNGSSSPTKPRCLP